MLFNVPQFIDIEDKIVGPLTAKQLGWIASGGVLILLFWATLDSQTFFVLSFFVAVIFGALAFYRPYNQPLIKFIGSSINFVIRPKVYIWKRYYDNIKIRAPRIKKEKIEKSPQKKILDIGKIREVSKILDQK